MSSPLRPEVVRRPTFAHRLEYVALRVVVGVLSLFPFHVASRIGGFVGRLGYRPLRIRRAVVERQLADAFPDLSARERDRIALAAYDSLGRVAVEVALASRMPPAEIAERFLPPVGLEHLLEPLKSGTGVIVISAHLGNWELGASWMGVVAGRVSAVVRQMANPLVDAYLTRARRRLGWDAIYDGDAVRRVPRAIADGQIIPMLADQDLLGLASTFVPFFGKAARTPKGPAVLALRLDAPCVAGAAIREPGGRFRVYFEPVPVERTGDRDKDVDAIVASYTRVIESLVRRFPEQYLWQHRRWRRRPDGSEA